jgi:hypothetical protein
LDFRGKDAEHEIMLSDPKAYRFRPVSLADLPRLRAWLQTPEVVRWWGDPAKQLELIREDLKDPRMVMCIVSFGGRPFAFVLANHNVRKRTGLRRLQQTPARRETTILDDSGQYLQLLRRIAPPTHDLRRL